MYCIKIPIWLIGLIKILLISMIFSFTSTLITVIYARQIIMDDWNKYQCNPLIIPLSSFFGHDPSESLSTCMFMNFKASSKYHLLPHMNNTNILSQNLNQVAGGMKSLSGITSSVQNLFKNSFDSILGQIGNFSSVIQYLIIKMETILQRLTAIVVVAMYSLYSILQGLKALGNSKDLLKSVDLIAKFPKL